MTAVVAPTYTELTYTAKAQQSRKSMLTIKQAFVNYHYLSWRSIS